MRQWAKTAIAVAASALVLAGAGGVHFAYSSEQFAEVGGGQWADNRQGYLWRLDGWTVSQFYKDKPPVPGAVFVVAEVSVQVSAGVTPESTFCTVRLIGINDTRWSTYPDSYDADAPTACAKAAAAGGEPVAATLTFEVPEIWATPEWIRGIAFSERIGFDASPLLTTTREG